MLRIRCLGQLSVFRDDQLIGGATAQRRRLAVLALLTYFGEKGCTRDKVIALLWTDTEEERARRIVSQALYALRRDLGSDTAIDGLHELRLAASEVTSDLDDFRRAVVAGEPESAAGVYGGPLLDGFSLPDAPEFERWLDEAREAVARQYADTLEKCAVRGEERDDHAAAAGWWRKLAAQDPLNPRIAIRLMRAVAASGDRIGAIRHAAVYEALVRAELDLPPDHGVAAYAAELRDAPAGAQLEALAAPPRLVVSTPAPVSAQLHESPASGPPPVPPDAPRSRSRAFLRWLLPAAVAVAVVGVMLLARRSKVEIDPTRIIVVPLENRTGDSLLDPVGQMAAEWITHGLARTGLVQVVDAQTMLEATRNPAGSTGRRPFRTIAEETKAGLVVSGTYYREGDSLGFQTEITEVRSGSLRHAVDLVRVPVGRPRDALEPLRQRVTGGLAVLVDNRLNNWTAGTSQPPTYEAYQEFLIGMEGFGTDFEEALRHFTRAARLDTTYWQALLWAGMSNANLRRYPPADSLFGILNVNRAQLAPYDQANLDYFDGGFVHGDWERSYQGARRMVELAPAAAHPLFALGLTATITNRPAEAIVALGRVNTAVGWGRRWAARIELLLSRAYHQLGDHDPELRWARRARATEPNAGWTRLAEVRALAALHRFEEAKRAADEGAALPETRNTWEAFIPGDFLFESGREFRAHGAPELGQRLIERAAEWYGGPPASEAASRGRRLGLASALYALNRLDDARNVYSALLEKDSTDIVACGGLGLIAQRQNNPAEAARLLNRLQEESRPYLFGVPRFLQARIAAVGGDRERAVAYLHQARQEGTSRIYNFHLEEDLDSLQDYPAYRDLVRPRVSTAP